MKNSSAPTSAQMLLIDDLLTERVLPFGTDNDFLAAAFENGLTESAARFAIKTLKAMPRR